MKVNVYNLKPAQPQEIREAIRYGLNRIRACSEMSRGHVEAAIAEPALGRLLFMAATERKPVMVW